ncbi:MAG TPA: biotin/lipoyl-binding protein, partial [Planctomycetota bacterium]|nr:biotin/lipoyl-binding protein [Planctomycetota bacterium]
MSSLLRRFTAVVGLGFLGLAGCSPSPGASAAQGHGANAAKDGPPREVFVTEARAAVWERVLRLTGELVPAEESTISTKVAGRLASLDVDVGSRVHQGQVIARIELRDFELRKKQAEAALEAARAVLGLAPGQDGAAADPEKTAIVREARAELDQTRR